MTQLPQGKTRLDLVREGLASSAAPGKREGRLIVSIDKIVEDPHNERKTFRNMEGLIASVKAVGLLEPLIVTLIDAGRYQIIFGHRRYRALKAAGKTEAEVVIRQPEDEHQRRIKSIVSNVQREDVGPVEMAEALQALMDEDDRIQEQDDLAQMIGKDKAWVSGMLRILTLPPALQRKVGTSQLSISYDTIIRIARLDDAHEQERLINAVLRGATVREVRQHIDEVRGKNHETTSTSSTSSSPKPKRVYHTSYKATVIVHAKTGRVTSDQCIAARRAAREQAQDERAAA